MCRNNYAGESFVDAQTRPFVKRISLFKVPVDILQEEDFDAAINNLLKQDGNKQIILLSLWDLLRARRNNEFRTMVQNAGLVIPISHSLIKAAKFLKKEIPVRYMPFDFIIKLLHALDITNKTVYLLGSKKKNLQKTERNLKSTFRNIRIVGRYAGYYPRTAESSVLTAIQKATPNLLLVGKGIVGRERWIGRNIKYFNGGLYLWVSDAFDVFADKAWRPSKQLFQKGLEWLPYTLKKPYKFFRFFQFIYFKAMLIIYRIRHL